MDTFCYLCFVSVMLSCLFIVHSLVVTFLERANLLALLYVMISYVFVTFPCGVLVRVWYLIVSIPNLYLLPYFGMVDKECIEESLVIYQ